VSGIVSSGVTGWLVPVGDVNAFACRLAQCMKSDITLLRHMGQAGASKAAQHHTVDAAAGFLFEVIKKIVDGHGTSRSGPS
jgi:glycosyltransferase involved in cell wall biosynthesis